MQISEALYFKLKERCKSLEKENSELKKQLSDVPVRRQRSIIDTLDTEVKSMFGYTSDKAKKQLKFTDDNKVVKTNFDKLRNAILRVLSPIVKPRAEYGFSKEIGTLTFVRIDEYTDEEFQIVEQLIVNICNEIRTAKSELSKLQVGDNNV